jgi:hypothetical protein
VPRPRRDVRPILAIWFLAATVAVFLVVPAPSPAPDGLRHDVSRLVASFDALVGR